MNEQEVEREIQQKGLTEPRLTPDSVEACIQGEQYHQFPGTVLTVCCLTLVNGFNTIGHSAPASEGNFDEELGQKIARRKAKEQIWALEGYRLKSDLAK